MGMLDGLVGQLAANAMRNQMGGQQGGGLGSILGSVLGGGGQQPAGMGSVLGSVLSGGQAMQPGQVQGGFPQQSGGGLGGILGSVLGGAQPPQFQPQTPGFSLGNSKLLLVLMPLVLMWIQRNGGIGNVLSSLTGHGLGQQANSWVGTGENVPLSGGQVSQLFGDDQIAQFAQQTGASPDEVKQGLGTLMPEVVNQLTPNGQVANPHEADNEIGNLLSSLKGMLGR